MTRPTHPLWLPAMLTILAACGPSGEDDDDDSSDTPEATTPPDDIRGDTPSPTPAPTAAPSQGDYLLFVPDNGTNQFKVFDPAVPAMIYSVDLADINPAGCSSQECMIYGGEHRLIDGHDYAELAYAVMGGRGLLLGQIDRVQLTDPPTLTWRLRELDFSALPGGASSYCPASESDPCTADPSASTVEQAECRVGDAHDFQILYDDPEAQVVELLVADTDQSRMYKVTLDYAGGNTCGQVSTYIDDERVEDWPPLAQPNNIVRVEEEGRELYFVTQRAVGGNSSVSPGLIQLWEVEGDGSWTLHWTFPENDGSEKFGGLRLPHGGEFLRDAHPDGHLFRFADSGGLSTEESYNPTEPSGGTVSTLLIKDLFSKPDYLHDLYVPADGDTWSFPRAATVLDDGLILVTDSGCQPPNNCPSPGRLIWIEDGEQTNSSRSGYWSTDLSQLELIDQSEAVVKTVQCGLKSPYWTDAIPATDIGVELTAARTKGGTQCE